MLDLVSLEGSRIKDYFFWSIELTSYDVRSFLRWSWVHKRTLTGARDP